MSQRAKKIHCRVFGMTDRGKVRETNEDQFLIQKNIGFFAVADGMGGHVGGEIASRTAVETSEDEVEEAFSPLEGEETWDVGKKPSDEEKMRGIVKRANRAVFEKNRTAPSGDKRSKMGTTFVCAKIVGDKIYIANTGDSRCYLIRQGSIQQLTADHSVVEEMVQAGNLQETDKSVKKMKNYITRCLGTKPNVDVDVLVAIPKIHDRYLLCSDGLTKMLNDEKIRDLVQTEKDVERACRQLISLANELGGRDNITVVMVQITGVGSTGPRKLAKDQEVPGPEDTLVEF